MEVKTTGRGFELVKFTDEYHKKCSLQKSSAAFKDCVWFGIDSPDPQSFIAGEGWTPYVLPEHVHCSTRMHLTRKMVWQLLPHLIRFILTGNIKK